MILNFLSKKSNTITFFACYIVEYVFFAYGNNAPKNREKNQFESSCKLLKVVF